MKGMNPYLADQDMKNMQEIKKTLTKKVEATDKDLTAKVAKAFSGSQTESMKLYINEINKVLEELFSYIDGKNSSFATVLNATIASYSQSDKNVASSYKV